MSILHSNVFLGGRFHLLPLQAVDFHRRRFRCVLPAGMELRVRSDEGRTPALQLRASGHSQRRHLFDMHHIFQRLLYGCGYSIPMFL